MFWRIYLALMTTLILGLLVTFVADWHSLLMESLKHG